MSDTSADQQEPSMEEILASIRRIISEDGDEGEEAVEATASEPEPGPEAAEAEDEDDVLELTDVVEPEEEPETEEPEPEPGEEPEPAAFEPEPEPDEAFGPAPEPEPLAALGEDDDRLISPETEVESTAAMAGLAAALAAQAPLGDSQKTLEALVKELMRPMLKDWLDANLPGLVERVVREEVERISKKAK